MLRRFYSIWLYKGGSDIDGGTLSQLRNLIHRKNAGNDVSKRVNACIDFFELATQHFVTTASMKFYDNGFNPNFEL